MRARSFTAALACLALSGCLGPPAPEPGAAVLWGYVELVPKHGVPRSGGGYADRRLQGAERVDYEHPEFVVVFCERHPAAGAQPASLRIVDAARGGARIEPAHAATTSASGIQISNASSVRRVVSMPSAEWVASVEPGATVRVAPPQTGGATLHLLGSGADGVATVWVAPGRFAQAGSSGRYVLRDVEPGEHALRAWHPRLPVSPPHAARVVAGELARVDLEIGVDVAGSEAP